MSSSPDGPVGGSRLNLSAKGVGMTDVALLIERALSEADAAGVVDLDFGADDPVVFHLLLPVDRAGALVPASMGALGGGAVMPIGELAAFEELQDEIVESARAELDDSAERLGDLGRDSTTTLTDDDPIEALADLVADRGATAAVIVTEPHVVREFLHVDWTSRAERRLDVPCLRLVEHSDGPARGSGSDGGPAQ